MTHMQTHPDQTTLIVHPGTGTILKADECVLINTDATDDDLDDHALVETAETNNDTLDGLHVVIVGNVFDGINIVGPFLSFDDAELWADQNSPHEWWVTSLTSIAKAAA